MRNKFFLLSVLFLSILAGCEKNDSKNTPQGGQVDTIEFSQESFTIEEGSNINLSNKLTITPEAVADTVTITWSIDNKDNAEISTSGNLRAWKSGKVNVTATALGKSATCIVYITEIKITKFTLSSTLDCKEGIAKELPVTCEPKGAFVGNLTYKFASGEDANITCYSDGGKMYVKALKAGTYHLTASYEGLESQTCVISATVELIESVTIEPTSIEMEEGETKQLTLTVKPATAKYAGEVQWKSSDNSVATVDGNGLVTFKAKTTSKAVITAVVGKKADGETLHTVTCSVSTKIVLIESVEISPNPLNIQKNQVKQLKVTVTPANATYANSIKWSSYNVNIASVDVNGNVKGCKPGVVDIKVAVGEALSGETVHTLTCNVRVQNTYSGTVTDICGNKYYTVIINSQTWMAENMKCNKYDTNSEKSGVTLASGTGKGLVTTPYYCDVAANKSSWNTEGKSSELYSNNDLLGKMGYLYNWAAVVGVDDGASETKSFDSRQGICPNGWHVPTKSDWFNLNAYVEKYIESTAYYLKSNAGWYENRNGVDIYSFCGLPCGYTTNGSIKDVSVNAWFASSTQELSGTDRYQYAAKLTYGSLNSVLTRKANGVSVRCVKNN